MIKKRNLDPSLIQWIMQQTGLGPGIGELHWVAKATSSSSQYRAQLQSWGVEQNYKIHSTVTAAYAKMITDRNDVMMVMPGAYDEGSSIDWTKNHTHMLGLGGPAVASDYSENNVVVYTDTAAEDFTIDLSGNHCIFANVGINNAGNDATSYAAMRVNGYNNWFENVSFVGNLGASQRSAVACASLYVHTSAHNCRWINCAIGEDCWGARTGALSGQLRFSSASQPNGGIFRGCYFRSYSATATVAMVAIPLNGAVGRGWLFENCSFHNTDCTTGANMNQVFYCNDITGPAGYISVKDCMSQGYDEWQDADYGKIIINMPTTGEDGGLGYATTHYWGET